MILHVRAVEVIGPHTLRVRFDNGIIKQVNVLPLLQGRIFEPLKDPAYFARVTIDPVGGTVVWPNGADFAPEALFALEDESELNAQRVSQTS